MTTKHKKLPGRPSEGRERRNLLSDTIIDTSTPDRQRAIAEAVTQDQADAIAKQTENAYSFYAYGAAGWRSCCRMLAKRGYSADEIKSIMRSKWTRWCRDRVGDKPSHNAKDLAAFIDEMTTEQYNRSAKELGLRLKETPTAERSPFDRLENAFQNWWQREGSTLPGVDPIHGKSIARLAWLQGASAAIDHLKGPHEY